MKTIGVVAVTVVLVGTLLYAVARPTIGWPDDARRFVHAAGFSLVAPEGWERHEARTAEGRADDAIRFLPIKAVGSPGYFSVVKLTKPQTEEALVKKGYVAITFAGRPAWERRSKHDHTREHVRSIVFERDGVWFDLSIRRPNAESIDVGVWKAYLESFRVEPVRSVAATLPTSMPLP